MAPSKRSPATGDRARKISESFLEPEMRPPSPLMLKDYLRYDLTSSCSSGGFKSFPRRECPSNRNYRLSDCYQYCCSAKRLIQCRTKKAAAEPPSSSSSSPSNSIVVSKLQSASTAVVKAVRNLPLKSPLAAGRKERTMCPRLLPMSVSVKQLLWWRSAGRGGCAEEEDQERWMSIGGGVECPRRRLSSSEIMTTTTVTRSGTTSQSQSQTESSWIEEEEVSSEKCLVCGCKNGIVLREDDLPAGGDEVGRDSIAAGAGAPAAADSKGICGIDQNDQEQSSPVSVLDYSDEEGTYSSLLTCSTLADHFKEDGSPELAERPQSCSPASDDIFSFNEEQMAAKRLVNLIKRNVPSINYSRFNPANLLLDFFTDGVNRKPDTLLLRLAEDWLNGRYDDLLSGWETEQKREAYIRDMEEGRRWESIDAEKEEIACELAAQFQSKRVLSESSFHVQGAEPLKQQVAYTETLDQHLAESSQQHVRALNTQFASWVQSQLQNHPDELWEDGVRDYLAHASGILEKFSGVVNWLKANAGKLADLPATGNQSAEKEVAFDTKINETNLLPAKPVFSLPSVSLTNAFSSGASSNSPSSTVSSAPIFATSWSSLSNQSSQTSVLDTSSGFASPSSSGLSPSTHKSPSFSSLWSSGVSFSSQASSQSTSPTFTNSWASSAFANDLTPFPTASATWNTGTFSTSQSPFKFGNQSAAPPNDDATDEADGENEEQPSSPSVKRNEEKGILVVHEVKCKLYVKSSDPADADPWKDKGTGQLTIKCKEGEGKGTKDSKPVILFRNDAGRILLNASLYPGIKTNLPKKNALVTIFHTMGDSGDDNQVVGRTFLIRTKNEEERDKLAEVIQECAPAV